MDSAKGSIDKERIIGSDQQMIVEESSSFIHQNLVV